MPSTRRAARKVPSFTPRATVPSYAPDARIWYVPQDVLEALGVPRAEAEAMPVGRIPAEAARLAGVPVWDLLLACDLVAKSLRALKDGQEPKPVSWTSALRKARAPEAYVAYDRARVGASDKGWALLQMALVSRDAPQAMPPKAGAEADGRARARLRQAAMAVHGD